MTGAHAAIALMVSALLTGCATTVEEPEAHGIGVTAEWSTAVPRTAGVPANWWESFGNDEMAMLVASARERGFDTAAADASVHQAIASVRIAGAPLLPELGASGGAERDEEIGSPATSSYDAGITISYELDLWGRNRASRRAALAALEAAGHDRDAVALIAETEAASSWLASVAAIEHRTIATSNLDAAARILSLVESRQRAGMASPLEVAQQRGLVASLHQRLATIERDIAQNRAVLAALVGLPAQTFMLKSVRLSDLAVPDSFLSMPSSVVANRPDVAAAERRLSAANADVAVARAAMLPRVDLTAGASLESGRLTRLFDDPFYSLAAGLTAPIFSGGRLAGERDYAIARREELLAGYRGAIVVAFSEVEQALAGIETIDREREHQAEVLRQAEIAVRLAESRYRAGNDTLLTMLDAQRTLYAAQEDALTLLHTRLEAAITLYRALGGKGR